MAKDIEKIELENDEQFPDHVPVIPIDTKRELEKKAIRDLTEELRKKSQKIEPIVITPDGVAKKASDLTVSEQEYEIAKCAINPIYFIETYLTIFDQTQGKAGLIVPFKLFDFQKELIQCYLDNRYVIANKYRQAGISTTTCAYIAWYIMFNSNRQVAIIADKAETARDEIMSDVVLFIEGCPEWLRPKTGRDTGNNSKYKDTQKLKIYDNDSKLGAFSAKGGLRGMTPTLIFWDETAWTEKGDKFWTAAKPTLGTGGKAIMVSCVTDDTFIYTDKGVKQIKDYIPNNTLGAHIIEDYNVLGKNKVRKGSIFFNNGYVDTLKINTMFSELESSYNHKYWGYKNNKYDIYKASELEIGDYISIQYGMNIWGSNDDCSDFKPTVSKNIKNVFNPSKITTDIAYLIGLYISEGYMFDVIDRGVVHTTQLTLTCGDSLSEVFEKIGFKYYFDGIHYTISSKNLGEFFKYLGFDITKKAKQKTIPSRVLEMSRDNIIAMIQGIMDGDGWSTYNKKRNRISVGIGLSSKELVQQLRILFGNFGVLTDYTESVTKPTKRVKVYSNCYRITASNSFAIKYLDEIGFRFERKQIKSTYYDINKLKHSGVVDNIPNGKEIVYKIYNEIKSYGKLQELNSKGIKIEGWINRKIHPSLPSSRKQILNLIEHEKENISKELLDELNPIINENQYWVKIKSIKKSKNFTYDFSLPNFPEEEYDFHHSVIYNQIIGYQTPSGLDSVFYKHFMGARSKENNGFTAVELWWYNDPRYNKELCWLKNKNKETEIRIVDENWSKEKRQQMVDDGWEASSPWFEEQVIGANGDMRKIAQELLCVNHDSLLTLKNKKTNVVGSITIKELYNILGENYVKDFDVCLNTKYEILNNDNCFVDFLGISKSDKDNGLKVTLDNGESIIVSEDHIFIASNKNMYVKSLIPNVNYITTDIGDFYVKSIEKVIGCEFYDIVDSENATYFANGFLNHNCSFLGSGDNFIAETYLKRIGELEVKPPIRQEYVDLNMWIWEDPIPGENYIMAIDASAGHGDDNSTINLLKTQEIVEEKIITKGDKVKKVKIKRHKILQVAEYYGKVTPQTLAEIAYQYGRRYNNAYTVIDITGGYGVQTVEKLLEIGYDSVHYAEVSHKPSRDRLQGYIKKGQKVMPDGAIMNVDLIPGFFIGNNRASVLLELQRAIHLEDVIIQSVRLLNELKTFVTVAGNRVADHKRSFHDDSIMGLAIGLFVLNFDMAKFKQSKGITEKMLNAIITNNDINDITNRQAVKNKPMDFNKISPNNPYQIHNWLFGPKK